jgi:undecaprenyl-diphosphatase
MDPAHIQQWLIANPGWVLATIAGLSFIESFALVGILIPGIALLGAASFAAGATGLELTVCLAVAWAGAVAGDGGSYLLGRIFHADIKAAWPFRRYPHWIANAERYFARHGVWGVAIGRFVGPIRPIIPLVAGILSMRAKLFFTINVLSAVAWAVAYIAPGYLLGAAVEQELAPPELLIGGALVLVALGALFLWRRRHAKPPASSDGGSP